VKSPPRPPSSLPPLAEPVIPPGYKKIAPGSVDTSDAILSQTAAIIEGDVSDVNFTYDGCAGPRTNYVITGARTLVGTEVPSQVTIKILGGPMPNGSWIKVSELPKLALDSHYVIFLRNTDWTFSPVVGDLALRREVIGGREVLVHPEGHAVVGWGSSGPVLSAQPVTAPVGGRVHGYRKVATAATAPPAASGSSALFTDSDAQMRPANADTPSPGKSRLPVVSSGSSLAQAPSAADIRSAGLFARPPIFADGASSERNLSTVTLIAAVKTTVERGNHVINGRLTLDPLWRCWDITPEATISRGVTTSREFISHQ
jgi:hypothetical protein